ncbi:hypothetical protein B0H14DRAFT_3484688 [Mycena olivaceomarginata]|nr:hypothetical protein B0H14DRAFT_3484688 [Mycena olivaceomarginata]
MTNVWSGGLIFSRFNASSAGLQFGMVTLSEDNTTAAAPAATYGAYLAEGMSIEASAALPPTPNDGGCACVAGGLGCGFVEPADGAFTVLVGTLVGEVYGLLPGVGGDCDNITANEMTGVYGVMAMCDPGKFVVCPRLLLGFSLPCNCFLPFPSSSPSRFPILFTPPSLPILFTRPSLPLPFASRFLIFCLPLGVNYSFQTSFGVSSSIRLHKPKRRQARTRMQMALTGISVDHFARSALSQK